MEYDYKKIKPIKLKDIGKDEKWLQDRINEEPSILGLGDLNIIQREYSQPSGGRIDFIMYDPEEDIKYEVEIMLGKLNESHIIRTLEYWDVERRRFPSSEHRAVIVAEEITNRFFNIIGLLNRAVPIIAIQLNAFLLDSSLMMNFVKVLDIMQEENEDELSILEPVDRKYWENRASKNSLDTMDKIINLLPPSQFKSTTTYNKYHVALRTTGTNFCWFHPRKKHHVHMHMKVGSEIKADVMKNLEEKGIETGSHNNDDIIKVVVNMKELNDNIKYIAEILLKAEERSNK